ncbi:MAG: hypothetical protein A2315_10435 [Ignavibacteria bacterium RIFOXYB2_FULL_35_12]|nr:MAG: hypothetical protein A2006_05640 [Ignavibacteria bacterium GWC2_35_8]OGU57988.1 MAG: hypothetical protein A2X60_02770 [Ignavibacteria bacterium GWF2_35_20]OGU78053.1 MAG: hypothetical protein A2254_09575 [Ignavibacteria bacterium RIFOXYA2_FULL_35_9]OGU90517.1 MAG: hypothetical protein A2492_06245 [Ignavibacteria bacterium RIFOXYC12_FULL_35_11]OGU91938.1 MAG: hypothetical protein A3K31_17610 [Ignavibacteria bacterium RIFOXYA12_FULL_35_25]OGU95123.1 MAG: hypothetical protein A2347_14215 
MKNEMVCKNCQTLNPFHELTCRNCKSYLRERVYNLDLWKLLEQLIESPKNGFTKIIYSEQKNFIVFIILIASFKFYLNTIFFFLTNPLTNLSSANIIRNYLILLLSVVVIISLFSLLIKITNQISGLVTRVKDIFSILSYSLIPNIFALAIFFPLELIFFGEYLFSNNPSPFIIKETVAYIMLVLELLLVVWTFFLAIMASYTLTKNVFCAIVMGILFGLLMFGSQFVLSFYLY